MKSKRRVKFDVYKDGKMIAHLVDSDTVGELAGVSGDHITKKTTYFQEINYHGYLIKRIKKTPPKKDKMDDLWEEFEQITRLIREACKDEP